MQHSSGFLSEVSQEIRFKIKVFSMYVHKILHKDVLAPFSCRNVYDEAT